MKNKPKKCKHCEMDLAIRNPSRYCDHLRYPENCEVCKEYATLSKTKLFKVIEGVIKPAFWPEDENFANDLIVRLCKEIKEMK